MRTASSSADCRLARRPGQHDWIIGAPTAPVTSATTARAGTTDRHFGAGRSAMLGLWSTEHREELTTHCLPLVSRGGRRTALTSRKSRCTSGSPTTAFTVFSLGTKGSAEMSLRTAPKFLRGVSLGRPMKCRLISPRQSLLRMFARARSATARLVERLFALYGTCWSTRLLSSVRAERGPNRRSAGRQPARIGGLPAPTMRLCNDVCGSTTGR